MGILDDRSEAPDQPAVPAARWLGRFAIVWAAQGMSIFSSSVASFGVIWWVAQESGSATALGTLTLTKLLPEVVLGSLAGALVDRYPHRTLLIVADLAGTVLALVLGLAFFCGQATLWLIYAITLGRVVANLLHTTAYEASLPLLVPERHFQRVGGLNQVLHGATGILAPLAGALLLAALGLPGLQMVEIVSALAAVLLLCTTPIPRLASRSATPLGRDLRAVLRYLRRCRGLLALLGLTSLLNALVISAFFLAPLLVTRHFGGSALLLGSFEALVGMGLVAGGLLLGVWGGFRRRILTTLWAIAALGAALFLIGLVPRDRAPVAFVGAFLVGAAVAVANGPIGAIVQSTVPLPMLGRVMAVLGSAATGAAPLGVLLAGPVADRLGISAWYQIAGVGCLVAVLLSILNPALMNIDAGRSRAPISLISIAVE